MRVLEVSLRKAGFTVTTATSVADALDKLALDAPELIISETSFGDGDGFDLRRRVRSVASWADIPFIFLTAEAAIENKIRGLELGVDDYLTKPIYIKEIVTRINILLQKRQRARIEERPDGRTRFAGRVGDMPVVDVIQTVEVSRKSGVIQFVGERGRQAAIYFRDGRVIDAEAGTLQGEDAVYRLLTWSEGEFEVIFRTVRRREVIQTSSQGLLMEGMRRLDEWSRLLEQLPPMSHRFEVDTGELIQRLGEVPDDNNAILRLIDGRRTLLEVIDSSDIGDLECLQAISRLYFEELLVDLDQETPRREPSGPIAAVAAAGSGPIELASLEATEQAALEESPEVSQPTVDDEIEPGVLLGGYRPSSLRLIDEAVAAAQAIEPSLFEDTSSGIPQPLHAHEIESDEFGDGTETPPDRPFPVTASELAEFEHNTPPRGVGDEQALKMIGSHGRDRAETSGELTLEPTNRRGETQRELVTIMPRRVTREFSTVSEPSTPPLAPPLDPPRPSTRSITIAGGVRRKSPNYVAIGMLVTAGLLTIAAIYLYVTRPTKQFVKDAGRIDGAAPRSTVDPIDGIDAMAVGPVVDPVLDALTVDGTIDAAVDATTDAPPALSREQRNTLAKDFYEKAKKAFAGDQIEDALEAVNQAVKLRQAANYYILRAQILWRLERVAEALTSLDIAEPYASDYPRALTELYEWRARMLWKVQRREEARRAMADYLRVAPDGKSAAEFQRWLDDPR